MRVLVCGDRYWDNVEPIQRELGRLTSGDVIIEGEAPGADTIARETAEFFGMEVVKFPADWKKYGRAAGQIRNTQMLKEGKPDEVWAFHACLAESKGTKNMVEQARRANIPVKVFEK